MGAEAADHRRGPGIIRAHADGPFTVDEIDLVATPRPSCIARRTPGAAAASEPSASNSIEPGRTFGCANGSLAGTGSTSVALPA